MKNELNKFNKLNIAIANTKSCIFSTEAQIEMALLEIDQVKRAIRQVEKEVVEYGN